MAESNVKLRVDARDAVNALQQTNRASQQLNNTLGKTEKRAATATGNIQRMGVSFRTTAASIVAITGAVTFLSRSLNVLGEREADALCRASGMNRAVHYGVERARGSVWSLQDRRQVRGNEALVDVLCVR